MLYGPDQDIWKTNACYYVTYVMYYSYVNERT